MEGVCLCCREKLDDDEEFEVVGDVSEALLSDRNNDTTLAADNDLHTNDGLTVYCHSC